MNKLLALFLAAVGFAALPLTPASAHAVPATVTAPVNGTTATLPAIVRINETVIIERHHRHFRTVRHVYYRHGVRHVTIRREYY